MDKSIEVITAKKLAVITGEPYNTIHYWATLGLLKSRKRGRTRNFEKDGSIRKCKKIRELQEKNYPLQLIKQELDKGNY